MLVCAVEIAKERERMAITIISKLSESENAINQAEKCAYRLDRNFVLFVSFILVAFFHHLCRSESLVKRTLEGIRARHMSPALIINGSFSGIFAYLKSYCKTL